MASILPSHFSISTTLLQSQQSRANSSGKQFIRMIGASSASLVLRLKPWKFNMKDQGHYGLPNSSVLFRLLRPCYASVSLVNLKWFSSGVSSATSDQTNDKCEMGLNRVDSLVQVLHKCVKSFSIAIKHRELTRSGPELAKAWIGVDVHAWHKHIAYQAAICALLTTAIEERFLLSDEHSNDPSPVHKILSPKIRVLLEFIENQLNTRDPKLVKWFKMVKLPLLAGLFIPLFKKWSVEHGRSGVAVIILAISCCVAVGKLGANRISCPTFTLSIPEIIGELFDSSLRLVSMDKLHSLASEAGLEQEFLTHFGSKVLPNKESQEVAFWIGLIQEKLVVAIERECIVSRMQVFHNRKDLERNLATLGLFALLGRRTRLFLSRMGIKDHDEQVKDFLSFLECGSLFIYPKLSSLPVHQLFMEVIEDEIGWLEFYARGSCISHHERRRSKQHAIQAEKEIILFSVFSVCSDVFSGFVHSNNSTQQSLDANLVAFILHSQNLLTTCMEDYLAAYYKSGDLLKIAERFIIQPVMPLGNQGTKVAFVSTEADKKPSELTVRGIQNLLPQRITQMTETRFSYVKAKELRLPIELFMKDILIGTQLLFIDISVSFGLLLKQMIGHKLTERERKKRKRALIDFASLIPVTILMILPLSVVGHAAILAAIKKYIPSLIPSPYTSERLDSIKQLNIAKKMGIQARSNLEDVPSTVS